MWTRCPAPGMSGPEPVGGDLAAARIGAGLDGVDVEMERARMIGIRPHHAFQRRQDLRSLRLHAAVRLPEVPRPEVHERVGEQRGGVEVVGEALRHLAHGVGVRAVERGAVGGRRDRVPLRESLDGRSLAVRDAARQDHGPLDGREGGLLPLGIGRAVVVRAVGQCDAPVAHRALRVEPGRLSERALGLDVVEGVHESQTLVEVGLGFARGRGDGLVVAPEAVEEHRRRGRGPSGVVVGRRLRRAGRQGEGQDAKDRGSMPSHDRRSSNSPSG